MPYTAEHKALTREKIVESARQLFNRRGFAQVSIDEIMQGAGLTRGGFYNHFSTKEELYAEAVTRILKCNPLVESNGAKPDFDGDPREIAAAIVNAYLSRVHLKEIDLACPLIALPSDVSRGGEAVRRAFREVLTSMIALLENGMAGEGQERHQRALAMAALCVGGMVLARAVDRKALAEDIRVAAHDCVTQMGGWAD